VRFILCGKNDAAVASLDHLVEKGDEVWAIGVAGDGGRDGWQRSFKGAALRLGVQFDQPRRLSDDGVVRALHEFRPAALISIQYDQILKGNLFRGIGCPCLNLHFALLPRHRGVAPIAWAVFSGDAEAGVTLHHMVEGIDAGDVIARKAVPVAPEDTAREVYDRVSEATAALFRESYPFAPALLARRLPQDEGTAVYHRAGDFDFSKRRIDWGRPAAELHRWIRAIIFPPMQWPEARLGPAMLRITRLDGAIGPAAPAAPGTVVASSATGIDVAAVGGVIRITGAEDPARPGIAFADLTAALAPGEGLA